MTITIRDAAEGDIPEIFAVRTSVRENHLSIEQMAEIGVTHQTILEAIHKEPCIWVAVEGDHIVGFSMSSSEDACLFAAFVRPEWEGQGIGRLLVERAEAFLFETNPSIWLHTDGSSRAAGFYEKLGWKRKSLWQDEEYRFEKHRPCTSDRIIRTCGSFWEWPDVLSKTEMVKGLGCHLASQSHPCRNPRSACARLWGFLFWRNLSPAARRGI